MMSRSRNSSGVVEADVEAEADDEAEAEAENDAEAEAGMIYIAG